MSTVAQTFIRLKLLEECAELSKELAKFAAYPDGNYPSVEYRERSLMRHIEDELADVQAAVVYFKRHFPQVDLARVTERTRQKLAVYDIYVEELEGKLNA